MIITDCFKDKCAVVTGAASGIGFALTEALLGAGAFVFMADRDTVRLAEAAEKLSAYAERVVFKSVDVSNQAQVRKLMRDAADSRGSLDFLFNNAGLPFTMPFETATLEQWRQVIDVNLWGVIYGIDAALPIMRRQKSGHIVNISSVAGIIPFPYQTLYVTAKFAVTGLGESLRYELEDEGIRVSTVCAGDIATRIYGTTAGGIRAPGSVQPSTDITAAEAAASILKGVAQNEGIIAFPDIVLEEWKNYRCDPAKTAVLMREIARERREMFRSAGLCPDPE